MPLDPDRILSLLRDPNVDSQEVAAAAGASREEAAAAARLVVSIGRARPEEVSPLPPGLGAAVVRAALAAGRADLLAALAAHHAREVAKEAKRGLHVLRSRGVATPEPARAPPPPPAPAPPEPEFPCFASAVDGQGERAVWIARAVSGRGVEVGQAVVSDVAGLLDLQVRLLGRKEFRAFARDVAEKGRAMAVAEVGAGTARSLVLQARALNESSGRPVPDGADAWLARLGPAAPPEDLSARFPPLPEEEERAAVESSAELHQLPVLRGWLADEDHLRDLARRLDEISVSPLYLDERQRSEQAARAVVESAERWLDEPRRRRLAGRLLAAAAHLESLGDAPHARAAAAVARAVAAGAPASRVPFARMMVEKAFPARPAAPAPQPSEPSLIVAPR